MRMDTLELQLAVIRLAQGILRAWKEWVLHRVREQNTTSTLPGGRQ